MKPPRVALADVALVAGLVNVIHQPTLISLGVVGAATVLVGWDRWLQVAREADARVVRLEGLVSRLANRMGVPRD